MTLQVQRMMLGVLSLTVLLLTGCASTGGDVDPDDPYESFNRTMFSFNKGLDEAILAPIAGVYTDITPAPARTAIHNVFANLSYLTTVVNQLLQGKFERGLDDAGRFLFNSTFGLGGLIDFSAGLGMKRHEEDFGQTLAVWGVSQGEYLELPFFGPSTMRDLPGIPADMATDLLTWMGSQPWDYVTGGVKLVDKRSRLDSAIKLRDKSSLDPYVFQREAYLQRRRHLIYDGNPPLDTQNQ
jgi:phospholipid-binding lipoprotein MlaA